jgi:hypothetical protein
VTLRDALASALHRLADRDGGELWDAHEQEGMALIGDCDGWAAELLSDSAFRAALTESIADGIYIGGLVVRDNGASVAGIWLTADSAAAAIVARMLP